MSIRDEWTMETFGKRFKTVMDLPVQETALFRWCGTYLHVTDEKGEKWLECVGGKWQCKTCGLVKDVPFNHKHT
jgi:hypothetical protein